MRHDTATRLAPPLAVLVLWGLMFVLSCRLSILGVVRQESAGEGSSVAAAFLGESRLALSGYFYEMADNYFHRGIEHAHPRAFNNGLFLDLAKRISPEGHMHIGGTDVREMMPWLWLAIRADPHNTNLYLVAAFWLAYDGKRPDLAEAILQEAQVNNPFNYLVQLEKGRLYLRAKRLAEAKRALDAGLAFWPSGQDPESEDAREDRASLLLYRSYLHEIEGEPEAAADGFEQILRMYPTRTYLVARIAALRGKEKPSGLAADLMRAKLDEDMAARAVCDRDEEEHGHAYHVTSPTRQQTTESR